MIKLQDFILNELIAPIDVKTESDLKKIDIIIQYCREMGENSSILWRGIKVKQNYPIYYITQDRDWFKGSNLGAQTILKKLNIKNPAFAYLGGMQSITQFFGRTFAIVLKKPYKLYQSPIVRDVMSWAKPVIYKTTNTNGGTHRQQVGTRTEEEQVKKALEGAKTYKQITNFKNLNDSHNEVIIDTGEYWAVDIGAIYASAGKFVKQYYKEKGALKTTGRVMKTEDYIDTYGEIVEILTIYRNFKAWKFKNPR